MCGIAGWVGPNIGSEALYRMTEAISHRGPDGFGHEFLPVGGNSVAAFGHRRLSIIDLAGGTQPMHSIDKRFTVTFNGEIYNYIELREELLQLGASFATVSDTEVIVEAWRAWGTGCLTRFRGMFAFALHDNETRQVYLARDPFGKKPVFYFRTRSSDTPLLVFCSEIAGLLEHPYVSAELNERAVWEYLIWRFVPGPETFFKGIAKLPPASVMTISEDGDTVERYWTPPEQCEKRAPAPKDPIGEFLEVFDESVRLRLRADVPIGAFLSSGLDSASIVASLVHLGAQDVRTYSIGYRGDPGSELKAAAETAAAIGTQHQSMEFDSDDIETLIPELSRHLGAPIAETACIPIYLMSKESAKHEKVILSGEGADELFGGYPKYRVEKMVGGLPTFLVSILGHALFAGTSMVPFEMRRLRIAARALRSGDVRSRMIAWFGALSPKEREAIWLGQPMTSEYSNVPFEPATSSTALRRVLHFDQTSWLPDNLLERIDMMTMAASLEARTPFMDVKLAEFSASLPDEWRINGSTTKRIIREALGPRLPQAVLTRPKIGFRLPVDEWFRGPLRDPFDELVLSSDSRVGRFIDLEYVGRMAREHQSKRVNSDKSLWSLYALEVFLREFF